MVSDKVLARVTSILSNHSQPRDHPHKSVYMAALFWRLREF